MENELAEFSILWRNVGTFHDLSKVLEGSPSNPEESYGSAWFRSSGCRRAGTEPVKPDQDLDELCEDILENEMLAELAQMNSHWDSILFDAERKLDDIAELHDTCIRGISDLTLKEETYRLNFKHMEKRINQLSARKVSLSERIAMLEEMYSHYAHYKCYKRTLDQIENNQFIKTDQELESNTANENNPENPADAADRTLMRTLEYVDKIAEKLNAMLPSIDASLDFFTIHSDYFDSDVYRYRYETMRTRVFSLIKQIFKELYNFANESCKNHTHFDIAEHYNKYRRIGRIIRNLSRYYTTQETEVSNAEFLQLQMYYITSRIKILNPLLLLKMESFDDIGSIASMFLLICNLEILTFKETFVSDATYESLGTLVENVAFYFMEACKKQMAKLSTSPDLRAAISSLTIKLIASIRSSRNEAVLQPLLLNAQQVHQTIELTLLKSIQKEIATQVRSYDKQAFLSALCEGSRFECDWEVETLEQLRGTGLQGAGIYPPVCYALGIMLTNIPCLSTQNSNRIVTEGLDAAKAALLDLQYAFGKQCNLSKSLLKLNQDLLLMRNAQHLLDQLNRFSELDSYRAVEKLYQSSEQQLSSAVSSVLLGDFQEFSRKQRKHEEQLYMEQLEGVKAQLYQKMPFLKVQLQRQLLPARFTLAFDNIIAGLDEVVTQYSRKFNLEPPTLPHNYDTESIEAPNGDLIKL